MTETVQVTLWKKLKITKRYIKLINVLLSNVNGTDETLDRLVITLITEEIFIECEQANMRLCNGSEFKF